jgi:hypothetical protein
LLAINLRNQVFQSGVFHGCFWHQFVIFKGSLDRGVKNLFIPTRELSALGTCLGHQFHLLWP